MRPEHFRQLGFGFVCSCCEKLHRAYARGYKVCEAAVKGLDCAGPCAGMSYPHYEGPLTRQTIATVCYHCGKRADKALLVMDNGYVGTCLEHYEHVRPTSSKALVAEGERTYPAPDGISFVRFG